jgi:hypothetical protein
MEYKVGDTVYMKGTVIDVDLEDEVLGLNVEFEQNGKEWVNPRGVSLCAPSDKTYEEGLQDAWKLASDVAVMSMLPTPDREKIDKLFIFDLVHILHDHTYEEVLPIVKAYKDALMLKVGDVVENANWGKGVVLEKRKDGLVNLVTEHGEVKVGWSPDVLKKTDEHIEIESLLFQIRGYV